jgi:transcriptional regulator with XRE-family HTH domain
MAQTWREARGLTVEAIASLTKIPARHVEALERGDASPLPPFYQRRGAPSRESWVRTSSSPSSA